MIKNTASQVIGAQMVTAADGSAFTGSVTCYVTGDAGTQAAGSVGSGACTHEGNGYHTYAPAQAETNYDLVAFTFTGTGAIPATVQVFTTSLTHTRAGYIDELAAANLPADIATAQADLDILTGADGAVLATLQGNYAPAKAGDAMTLANDAITAAKFDESTAFPLAAADTGATQIARVGADGDTLETLSDQIDLVATAAKLLKYIQLLARSDSAIETDNSSELTAINADGGSGAGNFSAQTDSVEALRDRGDAAWITATGFMPNTEDGSSFSAIPDMATATNQTSIEGKIDLIPTNPILDTEDGSSFSAIPWNAAWDVEVQSEVADGLNAAIPASPAAGSMNAYIQQMKFVLKNKMEITEANGNTTVYKDDGSTPYCSVAAAFSTDSTTTTRKALE